MRQRHTYTVPESRSNSTAKRRSLEENLRSAAKAARPAAEAVSKASAPTRRRIQAGIAAGLNIAGEAVRQGSTLKQAQNKRRQKAKNRMGKKK